MNPPKGKRVIEKQVIGVTHLSSKVVAQVETCQPGQLRLIIGVGVDLVQTCRVTSADQGFEFAKGYFDAEYGERAYSGAQLSFTAVR